MNRGDNLLEIKSFSNLENTYRVYHGSNLTIKKPKILTSGFTKDFGFAFYVTKIQKQVERWALQRSRKTKSVGFVSVYEFTINSSLNILKFEKMTEAWLDFIIACRNGEKHNYDIVEGPMADDQVYNWITLFLEGDISREAFWELTKFKYPTHQLALCSEESLNCIKFVEDYKYE